MKLEKLSEEHEKMIPEFRKKWIDIGLSTKKMNWKKVVDAIKAVYKAGGQSEPEKIIRVKGGPASLIKAYRDCIKSYSGVELSNKEAWKKISEGICFGTQDASWLSFYEFFLSGASPDKYKKPLVEGIEEIKGLIDVARYGAGWWIPLKKVCLVSEPPVELHMNEQGQLHFDGGMALKYSDGEGVYALNGIRIPKKFKDIVEKPAEEIDPALYLEIENPEIKKEFVRKLGQERVFSNPAVMVSLL